MASASSSSSSPIHGCTVTVTAMICTYAHQEPIHVVILSIQCMCIILYHSAVIVGINTLYSYFFHAIPYSTWIPLATQGLFSGQLSLSFTNYSSSQDSRTGTRTVKTVTPCFPSNSVLLGPRRPRTEPLLITYLVTKIIGHVPLDVLMLLPCRVQLSRPRGAFLGALGLFQKTPKPSIHPCKEQKYLLSSHTNL